MNTLPHTLPRFFWHFIKPQLGLFMLLALGMVGWSVQESVFPYFIKLVIDKASQYVNEKESIFTALTPTLTAWLALWLTIECGFRLYDFLSAKVYPRLQATVRSAMFDYALSHSHQFFANQFAGTMGSKISRIADSMINIITVVISIFFPVILAFCINIVILFQTKPLFAFIMGGWFTLHIATTYYFTKQCAIKSSYHSEAVTTLNGKIVDAFANIANIRFFARKNFEMHYFSRFQAEELKRAYNLLNYSAVMKLILGLASQTFVFTMIGVGLYTWKHNWITTGELALVLTSISLMGLAWLMGMNLIRVFEDIGTCKEALTLIQKPHDITDAPNAKPIVITKGEIVFDNVSFHYSHNRKLFRNKSVVLRAGEKVGLVGFSGSGKTTFVNLILRIFDIESGRILIDGQDIKDCSQNSLREQIALIPQDTSLFHRTLMENIRYGNIEASDEEVIEASKKTHCQISWVQTRRPIFEYHRIHSLNSRSG